MTDTSELVKRMRDDAIWYESDNPNLRYEAADRIEALEKALREIIANDWSFAVIREIARAALNPEKQDE